jgi:hypothetical protein
VQTSKELYETRHTPTEKWSTITSSVSGGKTTLSNLAASSAALSAPPWARDSKRLVTSPGKPEGTRTTAGWISSFIVVYKAPLPLGILLYVKRCPHSRSGACRACFLLCPAVSSFSKVLGARNGREKQERRRERLHNEETSGGEEGHNQINCQS